ncbi:MAG: hypothetical protein IH863_07900, partial [Chloroflexi bacterium]|nr:hypothetical protein [Chloroflexota bacterium]
MDIRDELSTLLDSMTAGQVTVVYGIARAISTPVKTLVKSDSDFANRMFAESLGLKLVMHHSVSAEPFTKDKFEHAMVNTLAEMGREASLALRGNRGH